MKRVPGAVDKIVHDSYHLATYMNKAVDQVRRTEHAALHYRNDDTLKGSRMLWLYGEENAVPRLRPQLPSGLGMHAAGRHA